MRRAICTFLCIKTLHMHIFFMYAVAFYVFICMYILFYSNKQSEKKEQSWSSYFLSFFNIYVIYLLILFYIYFRECVSGMLQSTYRAPCPLCKRSFTRRLVYNSLFVFCFNVKNNWFWWNVFENHILIGYNFNYCRSSLRQNCLAKNFS